MTPNTVPVSMPPAAAVPIDRLPAAPAPLAMHNGISPAINAKEVMSMGLSLSIALSTAASNTVRPLLRKSWAYSTMSIAFLPSKPMSIT